MKDQITNIQEAKDLIVKYKGITVKNLQSATSMKEGNYISYALTKITRFGLFSCTLCACAGAREIGGGIACEKCIHKLHNIQNRKHTFCINQETYQNIIKSKTFIQLKRAIQKRARFLEHLVRIAERLK